MTRIPTPSRTDRGLAALAGVGVKSAFAHGLPPAAGTTVPRPDAGAGLAAGQPRKSALQPVPYVHRRRGVRTCLDTRRDRSKLCVVETPPIRPRWNATAASRACTFVLMGKAEPARWHRPEGQSAWPAVWARDGWRVKGSFSDQLQPRRASARPCDRGSAPKPRGLHVTRWHAELPCRQ